MAKLVDFAADVSKDLSKTAYNKSTVPPYAFCQCSRVQQQQLSSYWFCQHQALKNVGTEWKELVHRVTTGNFTMGEVRKGASRGVELAAIFATFSAVGFAVGAFFNVGLRDDPAPKSEGGHH
jgi:hypothetical protein